jgi:hypothetical protein
MCDLPSAGGEDLKGNPKAYVSHSLGSHTRTKTHRPRFPIVKLLVTASREPTVHHHDTCVLGRTMA